MFYTSKSVKQFTNKESPAKDFSILSNFYLTQFDKFFDRPVIFSHDIYVFQHTIQT